MIINEVSIRNPIKKKLRFKHGINEEEINEVLLNNKPIFKKSRGLYLSIGFKQKYLTIIFSYDKINKMANIITAYPSSKWQINLYKEMKK
ncbi:MAG: hypothetical protein QT11_C0001G0590 [archaeon GW2011_AR20]|nr:MAG: hypothetical protein QT11_C0001G0590 [archaeon GW2011_AR20]MBS3160441.1 hypothetical protein [Candidatus Woesearchaeota archaeon]